MQWAKVVAVVSGMALLLSTTSFLNTFAQDLRNPIYVSKKIPVDLTLEMNGCLNDMTCGAEYFVGETVNFSGSLMTSDGKPLPNQEITIIKFLTKPELVTIAKGITGLDGAYEVSWTAGFTPKDKAITDVTKKFLQETVVFYAMYEGDDTYKSMATNKLTATVKANTVFTTVNAEKRVYGPGESALIFLAFIDGNDEFVDPESIRVLYDDQELKVEQKKVGSFTVVTPSLTVDHHQLLVMPLKEGYNIENGFLTVQVSGFFGKV
jgi:hypothetical protein